jgi:hypothetical protein
LRPGIFSTIAALHLLAACTAEPSEVFIPGPAFQQSIRLSTAQGERGTVAAGEPLVLLAERRTGPWVAAARSSLAAGACWLAAAPPQIEPEVADNVRWFVEPEGSASFNVEYRSDRTRQVRFSRAGSYRLTAQSAASCAPPFSGNTLRVEVVVR